MMPWTSYPVVLACVLLDKASSTPVRLSFDPFFLDFPNLEECGDNAWEKTEFVRSGAEDCLRAIPCPDWVDQPSFIGLGNVACVDGQAEFQGGVLKFPASDEIPNDIEACVRRVLTSEDCLPIFQSHWSDVQETPNYQSDRFPLYPESESIEIDTVRPVQETESAIVKEQVLPIVPMAAAGGGVLLLIFLSTFIVYRKKRIQNGLGFHNLGSKKSVPITPLTVHSETTDDMENGALSQRDSLSPLSKKRSSTTLEDMLGRVSVTSLNDDDCGFTPETTATARISSHLGSTFSDDEDDNRLNGPQLKVAPSPNPYDTRLVIENSDDDDDDDSYPVISIHSQDEESTNRFIASPQPPFSISEQPPRPVSSVQSPTRMVSNLTTILHDGEHSIEDPELVFFNDKSYDPDAFLGEKESVVELFSESSSFESDARDFDLDNDWDPDDASVTTNDEEGLALNGTGEFSFHAGIDDDDDDPFSRETKAAPRGLLDWSLDDIPEFHKASSSSLPTLLEESDTLDGGRQRSFSLATNSKDSWS